MSIVSPGATLTYTIVVNNIGPSDAPNSTVSDLKPTQIDSWDWICASQTGGASACTPQTGLVGNFSDTVDLPAHSSITYTVTAHLSATASGSFTNTVTVSLPSGITDPTPSDNTDDDTDIILAAFSKALVATNQGFTPNNKVAVGEILTYEIVFTVPSGGSAMSSLTLTDVLDRGLAFVKCDSIVASNPAIVTTLSGGFSDACNAPINPTVGIEPPGSPNPADHGRKIVFALGDVSNGGAADGSVTLRYQAVVLDNVDNQDGLSLNNAAALDWSSGTLSAAAPDATIVEPDFALKKTADVTVAMPGSVITFTLALRHTDLSNVDAFDATLTDVLPAQFTYVPGSLHIVSGPVGGVVDDSAAPTLKASWATFPLMTGASRTRAVVQFQAKLGNLAPGQKATNSASFAWTSLPGNVSSPQSPYNSLSTERFYDPLSNVNVYGVSSSVDITVPILPSTGFAPNVITAIPAQPADKLYANLGDLWLEIPKLGVQISIVGIPAKGQEWDLTWLADQAGWLEDTAYPTHDGNSALTAHVYLSNGAPGPFVHLSDLRYGDQIIVHLGGQKYVYEVRQTQAVPPYSLYALRHEKLSWLTLITCKSYDEKTGEYLYRVIVRAVLIKVE